jgi:hypothetical protein
VQAEANGRFIPEVWQLLPYIDKGFLRNIFRPVAVIYIAHANTKYFVPITFVNVLEHHEW